MSEPIPTPDEFAAQMRAAMSGDPESDHCAADELMCHLLQQLGYVEAVEIFGDMERWYA